MFIKKGRTYKYKHKENIMSKKQYLKALNKEIQNLNGIIDCKIVQHADYKREARRHKALLQQVRKEERMRAVLSPLKLNFFSRA
jgi:hypothetical protein